MKATIRTQLLTARRSLPSADLVRAAEQVCATLIELERRRRPATVAAYVPVGNEPGGERLPAALAEALPPDSRLLLPILLPDLDLDWAEYTGPAGLTAGPRGLREPDGPPLGQDAIAAADLVIVPALAVDRRGVRLGRGGGSYDRALSRTGPGAFTVALLHDGELLPAVPAEPHDRRVDATVTPSGGLVTFDPPRG